MPLPLLRQEPMHARPSSITESSDTRSLIIWASSGLGRMVVSSHAQTFGQLTSATQPTVSSEIPGRRLLIDSTSGIANVPSAAWSEGPCGHLVSDRDESPYHVWCPINLHRQVHTCSQKIDHKPQKIKILLLSQYSESAIQLRALQKRCPHIRLLLGSNAAEFVLLLI